MAEDSRAHSASTSITGDGFVGGENDRSVQYPQYANAPFLHYRSLSSPFCPSNHCVRYVTAVLSVAVLCSDAPDQYMATVYGT